MLLEEFRNEVRRRVFLPSEDMKCIPKATMPLIMEAAERKFGISNNALYDNATFLHDLLEYTDIFGSFCGWADTQGNVHAFGYACHERFRYWFTPDSRGAEQTMAHISTSNPDIEDMMSNITHPKDKTRRMVRGILTFCHSVNNNVWWHEEVLKHHYLNSENIPLDKKADPTQVELAFYLHNVMPKEMGRVKMAQPYGYLNELIDITNTNARSDREKIVPYDDQTMQAKFKPCRMYRDKYEAAYYDTKTTMLVTEFQQRLARLGY